MADYIDREALLHDIEQSVVYTVRDKEASAEMRGANKIVERIKCAAAVEPVYIHEPTKSEFKRMAAQMDYTPVVHGRWVHTDWAYNWTSLDECSVCGYHEEDKRHLGNYAFCPSCGAKMDLDGGTAK